MFLRGGAKIRVVKTCGVSNVLRVFRATPRHATPCRSTTTTMRMTTPTTMTMNMTVPLMGAPVFGPAWAVGGHFIPGSVQGVGL
eukprot:6239179-Lingulodinium_polyedra.AAC.1